MWHDQEHWNIAGSKKALIFKHAHLGYKMGFFSHRIWYWLLNFVFEIEKERI